MDSALELFPPVFGTVSCPRQKLPPSPFGKAKGKAKDQGDLLEQMEGSAWLEAPWKLAPAAVAALANPLTFENMSYIFFQVTG